MSVVRFIPNVNRLATAMSGPGGKPVSQALEDADAGLKELEPPGIEAIDEALAEILATMRTPGPLTPQMRETLYDQANRINALGALFDLENMGRAAWCLCEAIDLIEANPPSGRAAVEAHIQSLRKLRSGDALSDEESGALLAGLEKLLDHLREEVAQAEG